ncbi:hypothetical protein [Brevundimonas fluminis]|jgi:hypothetical protein|uniref:hypothetical protein n=1 Tax=Brevundimonas fluminis TaxID=2487274 RepID=UPI000F65766E|nr:hypothetical protein [Brevundimonas fluminis]
MTDRALTAWLSQGWELENYSATAPYGETVHHCFLLRRHGQRKIVSIRKKMMGKGVVVTEMDV